LGLKILPWRMRLTRVATASAFALWASWNVITAQAQQSTAAAGDGPSLHYTFGGENGLGGGNFALKQRTSAWELMYEQPAVVGPFGLELSYLNEGYLGFRNWPWYWVVKTPLHYRDNFAVQLDYWTPAVARCRLGAAAGPDDYSDTTTSTYRTHYEDRHGLGLRGAATAQCHVIPALALEVSATRTFNIASYDATELMFGIAYTPRWHEGSAAGGGEDYPPPRDYLLLDGGKSRNDSFRVEQQQGIMEWLTYGEALKPPLALEYSALSESITGVMQRRSIAAQLVASHAFAIRWLRLFAGVGPEVSRTSDAVNLACNQLQSVCDETKRLRYTQLNLLLSYGFRIPIGNRILFVVKFGRTESSSGRTDTDLLTAGIGMSLN
jgi:hypothetical protein